MEIFEALAKRGHEQLVFWSEPAIGYKGLIAIHDTTLGPALGGTRFWGRAMILQNQGTISADVSGQTIRIQAASFTNTATLEAQAGATLNISSGSWSSTGTLSLTDGTLTAGSGVDIQGGLLTGTGTINASLTNNGGDIRPGGSGAGTLTLNGTYTQNSGSLTMNLGGTTAGTDYDQLLVSGAATFSDTLNVNLINGFSPLLAQTFDVVTFASQTGTFGTVNLPALGGGLVLQPNYLATTLQLEVQ